MDEARQLVAPELRAALDLFPPLDLSDQSIAAFRQPFANRPAEPMPEALAAVQREEIFLPGAPGSPDVRCLLYRPAETVGDALRPAYLHIHGGGFVLGMADMSDLSNRAWVAQLGCVVLSVDYRLAPETPFPGARDDCYAALAWLHDQADALGIDPTRIAIGGESAGGGHAVALAIHARDLGAYPICFMLLDAPMLDDRTGSSAALHPVTGRFVWTPVQNRYGWGALLGQEAGTDRVPMAAVPARCPDLSGLPPAFISVGALDLFLEEDIDFARRLLALGIAVELHVTPGAYHGFGLAGPDTPQMQALQAMRLAALRRALQGN
ncbi:arylesterase [Sphingobium sp. IP1]|uniref:alpha/beta hydrolase n=1 Tax=Sphingobium sp. IP1 TaxID=2021637 RepID=UPI000C087402|nr:arylesterase [Sphingobium sp. IP1]